MSMVLRNKGVYKRDLIKNLLLMGILLNRKILFNSLICFYLSDLDLPCSSADSRDPPSQQHHPSISIHPSFFSLLRPPLHLSAAGLLPLLSPCLFLSSTFPSILCPTQLWARLMKRTTNSFSPLALILISSLIYSTQRFPHSAQFNFVVFLCVSVLVCVQLQSDKLIASLSHPVLPTMALIDCNSAFFLFPSLSMPLWHSLFYRSSFHITIF